MHDKAPKLLEDIRDAAASVSESVSGLTLDSYDNIDHAIVWDVITYQLPPLIARVEELLREVDEEGEP